MTLFDEPEIKTKWNTPETFQKLAELYPAPEYALLKEVGQGTGGNGGRYADAVVMSLYPSRGLYLSGFEIKTSRADWLSEMKNPKKADAIGKYCDFWYLVIGSNEIVKPEELPMAWGLIEPAKGKLKVTKRPEKIDCLPLNRAFLASVMRRANEKVNSPEAYDSTINKIKAESYQKGLESGQNSAKYQVERLTSDLQRLNEQIKKFEEISGLKIDKYNGEHLGDAVKLYLSGGMKEMFREMDCIKRDAARILEICEKMEIPTVEVW